MCGAILLLLVTITHCVQATVAEGVATVAEGVATVGEGVATVAEGVATAVKMFSMGRTSAQQALIMPDRRTVYMSIDSSNKPFLKFVANNENDLTSGCLFTAKIYQNSEPSVEGMTLAPCTDTCQRFCFQNQIKHYFGYFDPENVFFNTEQNIFFGVS